LEPHPALRTAQGITGRKVRIGPPALRDRGRYPGYQLLLHGFFFQIIEVNGEPLAWRSWEDVVNVPAKGCVRIARLPDDRPGSWMYHCHLLEYHTVGMMAHFEVVR
jgi:FtsP/CotA-like multicopper oxidase with cupredoxin domain